MTRGGARAGAGRPRLDRPKERHNFIWDPDQWEYLQSQMGDGKPGMAATVEALIFRDDGFIKWMEGHKPMSMAQVRQSRGVPAKRGGRVLYTGGKDGPRYGTIKSARGGYLMILLDGDKFPQTFHPTWKLEYLDADLNKEKSCQRRSK